MIEIMPIEDYSKNTPLYVQLYEYIKKEIQIGTIEPETKLPSKRKLTSKCLYSDQSDLLLIGEPQGEECLRKEISKYLFQSRSVRCVPEQIVIGAGTQYLIMIVNLDIRESQFLLCKD